MAIFVLQSSRLYLITWCFLLSLSLFGSSEIVTWYIHSLDFVDCVEEYTLLMYTKWFLHASVNESSYFPAYEPSYIIKVCWLVLMCSSLSVVACVIIAIVSFCKQLFIIWQCHEELNDGFPFNFWCICLYLLYFLDLFISIDIRH